MKRIQFTVCERMFWVDEISPTCFMWMDEDGNGQDDFGIIAFTNAAECQQNAIDTASELLWGAFYEATLRVEQLQAFVQRH